jgi:cytochrome c551/c552
MAVERRRTHRVKVNREMTTWGGLALMAMFLLGFTLHWQTRQAGRRWATVVPPNPLEGSLVFQEKGCARCHGRFGEGSALAPPLRHETSRSLPHVVTAMWNHAPSMWESIRAQNMTYPSLNYEETGQLLGFLYVASHTDPPGDPARGRAVFQAKGCSSCHSNGHSALGAPPVDALARAAAARGPLSWTESLWNHAAAMDRSLRQRQLAWPRFEADELNDLFSFLQQAGGAGHYVPEAAGDPGRGWEVFQRRSCIKCHSVRNDTGPSVSDLGAPGALPSTFSRFGARLLNHFPQMQQATTAGNVQLPAFAEGEMTDLAAFLYSLQYVEPSGSAPVGGSIFQWRGCAQCHGPTGQGTQEGPPLRGVGRIYTSTRLAADMWDHGGRMYEKMLSTGRPWPMLRDSDIGDLLAFLNSPADSAK